MKTWEQKQFTKKAMKKSKKCFDMHGLLLAPRPPAALKRDAHFILTTYLITSTGYIKEPVRESRPSSTLPSTVLPSTIDLIILRLNQRSTR